MFSNIGRNDIFYANDEGFMNYHRSQKLYNKLHGPYDNMKKDGEIQKVKGIVTLSVPDDQDWLRNKLDEINKNSNGKNLEVTEKEERNTRGC